MSVRTIEARAIVSAKDATGGVFARIAGKIRALEATTTRVNRASAAVSRSGSAVLGTLGRFAAPAALAAGAVAASKNFAAYDRQLSLLANTADATAEQMAGVRREIGATAREVAEMPDQVLRGTQAWVAAVGDIDTATAATRETARAAKAFGVDIEDQAAAGVAVVQNLGIAVERLNRANEIMAAGANIGLFEAKDIARHLPSIAAAAKELRVVGESGLGKLVTHLEVVRTATGDSATAANDYYNLLSKIVSNQTIPNVNKMAKAQKKNVDLTKEIEKGYANGTDAVTTFLRVVRDLTDGNPYKIKSLVPDMQANRALTALISHYGTLDEKMRTVMDSAGLVDKALKRVMTDSQSGFDKLAQAFDRLMKAAGAQLGVTSAAGTVNAAVDVIEMPPDQQREVFERHGRKVELRAATGRKATAEADARQRVAAIAQEIFTLQTMPGRGGDVKARIAKLEKERDDLQAELDSRRPLVAGAKPTPLQSARWEEALRRLELDAVDAPPMPAPAFPMPPGGYVERRAADAEDRMAARNARIVPLPPRDPRRGPAMLPQGGFDDIAPIARGGEIKAIVEGPVTATVTGQADVNVRIQIDASEGIRAAVKEALGGRMRIQSAPTGKSMREAMPPNVGPVGEW